MSFNILIPKSKEECLSQLSEFSRTKSKRDDQFVKQTSSGYFKGRRMLYEALRLIFFTTSKRIRIEKVHTWFDEEGKDVTGFRSISSFTSSPIHRHIEDIVRVIVCGRKLAKCCLFLDRIDECREILEIIIDICLVYHRLYFVKDGVCEILNLTNSYYAYVLILQNELEEAQKQIDRGFKSVPDSNALNNATQFLYLVKSGSDHDFRASKIRFHDENGIFGNIHVSQSMDRMEYSNACYGYELTEKDYYNPLPFRKFLQEEFTVFDDLEKERIQYLCEQFLDFSIIMFDSRISLSIVILIL